MWRYCFSRSAKQSCQSISFFLVTDSRSAFWCLLVSQLLSCAFKTELFVGAFLSVLVTCWARWRIRLFLAAISTRMITTWRFISLISFSPQFLITLMNLVHKPNNLILLVVAPKIIVTIYIHLYNLGSLCSNPQFRDTPILKPRL